MARLGRPSTGIEKDEFKIRQPVDLMAKVKLLLKDPAKEKLTYGALNQLIEKLLRRWVEDKIAGRDV